jgi:hypothetical protein
MSSNGNHLVFVSHGSRDTWVASRIADAIRNSGAVPFLDEAEIQIGADFEEKILQFLAEAHELVVLFTPWSLDRPYVWSELGAAWIRRIPIVVVLHGITPVEFQTRPGAPTYLKKRDIVELNEIPQYFTELGVRVRARSEVQS